MILVIDNYDSFTFNLVQLIGTIVQPTEVKVFRNDKITIDEIRSLQPSHLVLSPGPCTPSEAGISVNCIEQLTGEFPILGVCLGHQSIGQATGAKIVRANKLMHGKTDSIYHDGTGLFAGLDSPITATRYHSLVIQPDTLSGEFKINAWTEDESRNREIMALQHNHHALFGLQFHPESFLTEQGAALIHNFLNC